MYRLIADAWGLMRLNFKPAAEYAYPLPVIVGALLVIGAVNAAGVAPWFQQEYGIAGLMFAVHVLKWPVCSWAVNVVLGYYGKQKHNFAGYILASEILVVPGLLLLYLPELGWLVMLWQMWAFVVTVLGLVKLSETSVWKVLLAHVAGFVLMLPVMLVVLLVFAQTGWLDLERFNSIVLEMMQQPTP